MRCACYGEVVHPTAAFIFLSGIPHLDIETLPSLDEKCAICTEPYLESSCELRDPLDSPVKIRCGHIFGHNCLVRWMLSDSFDNQCPFCRAKIVDESDPDLRSPDPNVRAQLRCFEKFVIDVVKDMSYCKQDLLEHFDQYRTGTKDFGDTPSEIFNKERVVMIWEEFLDMRSREAEEDRLWKLQVEEYELRLREYHLEKDRLAAAEAALRLEQQQENHRRWSRNRIAIIVSVAAIVIFTRLGLLWNSYQNGALWPTGVPQLDVHTCGWLLATLIAIGSPWQLYLLIGLFSPGLVTNFGGQLALIAFGGLGLVNDVLFLVVADTVAGV